MNFTKPIQVICSNCDYVWTYKGKLTYPQCPNCKRYNMKKIRNDLIDKAFKKYGVKK
jgi:exosome complex RNA-binding protein Csl4